MVVLKNVTCMNGGDGENSYANNSIDQRAAIVAALPVVDDALKALMSMATGDDDARSFSTAKCLRIADFGCSSGPNTVFTISHILDTIEDLCRKGDADGGHGLNMPEFEVFLNDLPDNDFNTLFKFVPGYNQQHEMRRRCSWYGVPGSFYDRLFPSNSLHFAFSCYSVHWLSQVPEGVDANNKGNINIARTTPALVIEKYKKQFQSDFTTFLNMRSKEVVCGGRMVLVIISRRSEQHFMSENDVEDFALIAQTLADMVAEGIVKKEDLYSFNMPIYFPHAKEVEAAIRAEGSFNLHKLEVVESQMGSFKPTGKDVLQSTRAAIEPIVRGHFGFGSALVDQMLERYVKKEADSMSTSRLDNLILAISLCRRNCEA